MRVPSGGTTGLGVDAPGRPEALFDLSPDDLGAASPSHLATQLELLPGIGPQAARALRGAGLQTWAHIKRNPEYLPRRVRQQVVDTAERMEQELADRNLAFFVDRVPRREHWRLAATFPEDTVFLDIETTGLSRIYHRLTVIGWSVAGRFHTMVGEPAAEEVAALDDLLSRSVLVTYNGAHFDVPFMRHHLPKLRLPQSHVDLRHLGQRLGFTGGQKRVEQQLGLSRSDEIGKVNGGLAPGLWFRYQRGEIDALRLLIEYNHADVDGLRLLLHAMTNLLEPDLPTGWRASDFDEWRTNEGEGGVAPRLVPFAGHVGPLVTLDEMPQGREIVVVGIDLSGSPQRVTGWARVHGADSITMPMSTDEEIVEATLASKPDLISIDAPLSLPEGRLHVEDSDPGRGEFGITRVAERILWKRDVKTYPALIQSMQGVTGRGIRLAKLFREAGLPVIESFPGAMQDMIGMPRKGVSVDFLKQSLFEYGLSGAFATSKVTHDEIDALSCAIVGQMFWDGKYEALGTEAEDYMVVPHLGESVKRPSRVIGLSGPTAAGKSTLAGLLESQGFHRIRYSEVIADMFPELGSEADRSKLREAGARIHVERGQRWLGTRVVEKINGFDCVVVDGVRFPEDRAFLIERFGSAYEDVYLAVEPETRRARFVRRLGSSDDFETADNDLTETGVTKIRERVENVFDNSGSLAALRQLAKELAAPK